MNDRLHQLLITVSRLDMEKLHPVARFAELLKFFGLLIVVSIGLITDNWRKPASCMIEKKGG